MRSLRNLISNIKLCNLGGASSTLLWSKLKHEWVGLSVYGYHYWSWIGLWWRLQRPTPKTSVPVYYITTYTVIYQTLSHCCCSFPDAVPTMSQRLAATQYWPGYLVGGNARLLLFSRRVSWDGAKWVWHCLPAEVGQGRDIFSVSIAPPYLSRCIYGCCVDADPGIWSRLPSKHETFTQCWFNVWPPSTTLAQHWTNIG